MANPFELRERDQARRFLLQGFWLQRVQAPGPEAVRPALEWALELAANGQPLPPPGFLADVGYLALGPGSLRPAPATTVGPGLPDGLVRAYEDHVLGKVQADWTFERAADALRRYQGRDRARGLAFCVQQIRGRLGCGGALLSPAVIKSLLETPADVVLRLGWEALAADGLLPVWGRLYEELIAAARRAAELLGPEDIFELEHGTALADMGQRVGLRQVLQAAERLGAALPPFRPRPSSRRPDVPTHFLDEDTYPVGGFSSLATRGSMESLLHSQLAYMEPRERPDLFDVKYLRDELLYYARDENQFLRRRRSYLIALFPDLIRTRCKDAELPWQRGVLLLALLLAAVRRLTDWLSTDALRFEFLFLQEPGAPELSEEYELLELLLREPIAHGIVELDALPARELGQRYLLNARRSLSHCLLVSTETRHLEADPAHVGRLRVNGPVPELSFVDDAALPEADTPLDAWGQALRRLLERWV